MCLPLSSPFCTILAIFAYFVSVGAVVSLGAGVGSLLDRAEVVDGSVGHLRNNFQIRLRR